jgi:hypothetical protein
MKLLSFLALAFACATVSAATKLPSVKPQPLGHYVKNGVIVGGEAGDAFSILRVEKLAAKDSVERLVIYYGNVQGEAIKATPGYFHINVDEKLARVSIDLAQVQRTAVDHEQLAKLFAGSKIVAATDMTMDPIDLSTNILLTLKQPAEVSAHIDQSKGVHTLVIDLRSGTHK